MTKMRNKAKTRLRSMSTGKPISSYPLGFLGWVPDRQYICLGLHKLEYCLCICLVMMTITYKMASSLNKHHNVVLPLENRLIHSHFFRIHIISLFIYGSDATEVITEG